MTDAALNHVHPGIDPAKFRDPATTADGSTRASVALNRLAMLWFKTGTLCNLECANCYIESSPTNDRLVYLTAAEVRRFLDEADTRGGTAEIGFTGGEPFMNPDFLPMLRDALGRHDIRHDGPREKLKRNAKSTGTRQRRQMTKVCRKARQVRIIRGADDFARSQFGAGVEIMTRTRTVAMAPAAPHALRPPRYPTNNPEPAAPSQVGIDRYPA